MSAESIAPLGFDIDTSALVQGAKAADQLANALTGVATATEKVDGKAKATTSDVKEMANAEADAAKAAQQLAQAVTQAVGALAKEQEALRKSEEAARKEAKAKKEAEEATKKAAEAAARAANPWLRMQDAMRGMQGAAANSNQHIENLTGQFGRLGQTIVSGPSGLSGGLSSAAGMVARFGTALGPVGGLVAGVTGGVAALGAAYVGLNSVLAEAVDRYALLEGRLKNVYGSASAAREVFASLTDLADKNALSIDQTAESYLRLARNNSAIGLTRQEMLKLTDAVQMLGRVSGASNGELSGAMIQFSQALAAGRLNGDELRSIMENMPALVKAIADGLGVSVGQVRAMGAAGELTGDKITKAILGQIPKIQKEFEGLPQTTEQAFTRVGNAWGQLLVNMGKQLDSSSFMQKLYNATARLIEVMGDAAKPETLAEERTRLMRENSTPASLGFMGSVGMRGQGEVDANKARIAEINRQLMRDAMETAQGLAKERIVQVMAPATRAEGIIKELDKVGTRTKELQTQRQALQETLDLFKRIPALFVGKESQMAQLPGLIAQIDKELQNTLPDLEKFVKGVNDRAADMSRYGSTSFGADVRKLAGTNSSGSLVSDAAAEAAVISERTQNIKEQTAQLENQIKVQAVRNSAIGKGREAEIAAEAQSKRLTLQYQLFGDVIADEAIPALERYQAALENQMRAEDAALAAKELSNAQLDLSIQKQLDAAAAAGANTGALRELETQLRRNKELEQASPDRRAAIAITGQAADLATARAERQKLAELNRQADQQGRLASGMSPADARRMQQEQDARQYSEGFSPAQQEAAYQAKLNELRAKDAVTIRQQLDEKQRSAELTQKEIALTAKGGLAAQVAIARERELNAIKASGLALTQAEVEARLKLAEQAVLDADALSKAQRTANAYVQMWQDAGQAVTSGLEQQFSKMLDGEKFKLKDFLEQIMKEIAMAVIRAQIISPISTMISDIGNGSAGGGGGGVLGGIVGSITSALKGGTAPAAAPAAASAAANDNAVATAPLTRSLSSAAGTIAFPGGGSFATVGNFVARGAQNVDPRLVDILKTAAERGGFDIQAYSGYRPGDPRFHGDKLAVDTRMFKDGRELPNYQSAKDFRDHERYAQTARTVQMEKYPELADQFRWGGYFSGPKGKYGALDLQHFDLGGGNGLGMAGGSWENGLTAAQRRMFPGAESKGIGELISSWTGQMKDANSDIAKSLPKQFDPAIKDVGLNFAKSFDSKGLQNLAPALTDVTKNAAAAAPAVGDLGSSLGSLLTSLLKSVLGIFGGGFAHGGVIAGGYSTTAYGVGGVVSKPTLFPMARGAGLMGEAGPEAILPLKRGPDGKLGVGGAQGGDSGVSVVVNDMRSGGQQVETQQERGGDGKRLIRLTIRDEVKGQMKNGTYDPEMRSQYGAGRVLARR